MLEPLHRSSPAATNSGLLPRLASEAIPLTFTQQLWCNILGKRRSVRVNAVAMRLVGRLRVDSLQRSVDELARRHESLRTRIVTAQGVTRQHVDEARQDILEVLDLTQVSPGEREGEAKRGVELFVNERVDIATGPLFAARLLTLGEHNHVLVLAADHAISDVASVGILWREVSTMYVQSVLGLPLSPSKAATQFADYAVWQRKTHRSWVEKHGPYWKARLAGARRVRLFVDEETDAGATSKGSQLPVRLGEQVVAKLRELSRRERTTLALTVLTAYAAVVMRWTQTSDLVVPFMSMGRNRREIETTVGFFGSALFLRIELHPDDRFLDLLKRVTREYWTACEHHDCGRIAAQLPAPDYVRNSVVNWMPQAFNRTARLEGLHAADVVRLEPFAFDWAPWVNDDERMWNREPGIIFTETNNGVTGSIAYGGTRVSPDTVQRFARSFSRFADQLATNPDCQVGAISCSA